MMNKMLVPDSYLEGTRKDVAFRYRRKLDKVTIKQGHKSTKRNRRTTTNKATYRIKTTQELCVKH